MSLFTHDLETESVGSRSRSLMEVIHGGGLSTLGSTRPIDLGMALQVESPHIDELVGEYLAAAAEEPRLVSLAMVAITPQVAAATKRTVGFKVSEEFADEICVQLLELLPDVGDHPAADRRSWLVITAVRRARSATRVRRVAPERPISLEDDFDVAVTPDESEFTNERLAAMWLGISSVISQDDFVLIDTTRAWGTELTWMANRLGVSYEALRKRRSRAEAKLRGFIEREVGR
jgi:DNA-directed RNA polymerase specialized sigma24 family protein